MNSRGDLGHSETGSGETVGRVLKKKKKKKKKKKNAGSANFIFKTKTERNADSFTSFYQASKR